MSGLYPIIRRIRRPLMPVDPPPQVKPKVEDIKDQAEPTESKTPEEKKTDAVDSNK
jgi:hypothetical protein